MRRRVLNITGYTVFFIIMLLIFGYLGSVFSELNAMDLYHCSAKEVGAAYVVPSEDETFADPPEIEIARMTKGYITKSMADSGILNDVKVDYGKKCIICRIIADGTTQAIQDGNDEKWKDICDLACDCSKEWTEGIRAGGLSGWDFSIVILNDYYPKNALAIITDGEIVYNCRIDSESISA